MSFQTAKKKRKNDVNNRSILFSENKLIKKLKGKSFVILISAAKNHQQPAKNPFNLPLNKFACDFDQFPPRES